MAAIGSLTFTAAVVLSLLVIVAVFAYQVYALFVEGRGGTGVDET